MSETITINIDVLGTGTSISVSMQRAREIYEELKAIFEPIPKLVYREPESPRDWRTRPMENDPTYWWVNDPISTTPRTATWE